MNTSYSGEHPVKQTQAPEVLPLALYRQNVQFSLTTAFWCNRLPAADDTSETASTIWGDAQLRPNKYADGTVNPAVATALERIEELPNKWRHMSCKALLDMPPSWRRIDRRSRPCEDVRYS